MQCLNVTHASSYKITLLTVFVGGISKHTLQTVRLDPALTCRPDLAFIYIVGREKSKEILCLCAIHVLKFRFIIHCVWFI